MATSLRRFVTIAVTAFLLIIDSITTAQAQTPTQTPCPADTDRPDYIQVELYGTGRDRDPDGTVDQSLPLITTHIATFNVYQTRGELAWIQPDIA